jgi:hypothetical protein
MTALKAKDVIDLTGELTPVIVSIKQESKEEEGKKILGKFLEN